MKEISQRDDTNEAPVELDRQMTHLRLEHLRGHLADVRVRRDRDRAHRHVVADLRRLGIMAGRDGAGEIAFGDDADEPLLVEDHQRADVVYAQSASRLLERVPNRHREDIVAVDPFDVDVHG